MPGMHHLLRLADITIATIALLLLAAGRATPRMSARPDTIDAPDLPQRLDAALRVLEADGFSGTVIVVRDGELVLAAGYGLADRARRRAATDRSLFSDRFGVETVHRRGILKLESEGRLRLSDPIVQYLPDVPANKRAVTLHHLLTRTSRSSSPPTTPRSRRTTRRVIDRILASERWLAAPAKD